MTNSLKLKAQSPEDLQIISAVTQDSIVRVGDIFFNKGAATLTLVLNRFKQEARTGKTGKRIKSGLRLNNVLSLQSQGIDRADPEAFAVLLSIKFSATKPKPTGEITMVFSGGGYLKANVEYLDAHLVDVANTRETTRLPLHPIND